MFVVRIMRLLPVLLLLTFSAYAAPPVSVHDGDSLRVHGQRIRLYGVDAPELAQPFGKAARDYLRKLVTGRQVTCTPTDIDRYQRVVAVCEADGLHLNHQMVRAGYAWAYRCYSYQYLLTEWRARWHKHGLWCCNPVPPWAWRRRAPSLPYPPALADSLR